LENLPKDFRPLITVVPDLHHSYFISPLFEVKLGTGRLLVCGLNLSAKSSAARLFKNRLWRYIDSQDFDPKWEVGTDWFKNTFLPDRQNVVKPEEVKLDADTMDMLNNN
jgi:hypothetical protein